MSRYSGRGRDPAGEAPPAKFSAQSLREALGLFSYVLPYKWKFVAALLVLLTGNLMLLALPTMTGRMVDAAVREYARNQPQPPAPEGEAAPPPPAAPTFPGGINGAALVLLGVLAVQATCAFFHSILFAEVGERSLADLRRDSYARLVRLPMAFFSQRRVGELTSRLSSDLAQIQDTLILALPHLIRQTTILVGGIVLIAVTSGRLTLVMLASLPALILVAVLFGRQIRKLAREGQDRLADTSVIVEETLQGITNVKAFANEGYEEGRYRSALDRFLTTVLHGARFRALFVSFIIFCLFGAIVLVLWYGARLVAGGDLTPGDMTKFMLYTMLVAGAMGSFAELYSQVQRTLGSTQRVRELLREQPEPLAVPAAATANGDGRRKIAGDVAFEEVTFSYPSRKETRVLKGVCLSARAGERIALVGPSGSGKSTIVALLLRFYEPDGGRVQIDGRDACEYGLHDLRNQMAMVPQDVTLFGGTIADNIAYGKPGAGQAEIEEAARQANAHEFIVRFPDGYQTLVGERGVQLSGGQRQRVAIARAILKNPAILMLDEATSSLDSESESLVQQALDVLMKGRTSVIIAHRLATVRDADRIYVIKDGVAVESGTHEELVAKENGVYRTLSELQFDLH
jgi:ATP-binding cassette subfamily B protein